MPAPQEILKLVARFREHYDSYSSTSYNEAQLRQEFVDPFLQALGWDVANVQDYAEAYKEVIHEDSIKMGAATKAPDYSCRIGGIRKFFVETKKPSINIKQDASPAFQLRRYGWSAKLPLSILTDFEEFAVYDCRVRPEKNDKASTARTLYLTYEDYDNRWDEIASIFSRGAILRGSFDKYADSTKKKRGTAEVDEAFLADIESWRETLAQNIAKRNTPLSQREVNYCVQQTIDRIIFLRICEDRGIEKYKQLDSLLASPGIYSQLTRIFKDADDRYNSGLFHFSVERGRNQPPDTLSLSLAIDDAPLKSIIRRLYYPESPYEFSVIGADILGQVYEQYLGKVIRLTKTHRAVIEEKPDVRKAGGVYYTPGYVVNFIVEQTIGKLLDGKTVKQAGNLRIVDPSCGSGSFLLGAYQKLLDWHLDKYIADGPQHHSKELHQIERGDWRLTTAERKRILLNSIYGVDIDAQAVEVTKLSLLLKVLEGENEESLARQLRLFKERALPDLGDNIRCGNSLIGSDFYKEFQPQLFDEEEELRLNVFDWHKEFPAIMKAGGFDAVLGNPPWGASFSEHELAYMRTHYKRVIARMIDSYIYFIDRAIQIAKKHAPIGYIIPSTILNQSDATPVRRLLLERGLSLLVNLLSLT